MALIECLRTKAGLSAADIRKFAKKANFNIKGKLTDVNEKSLREALNTYMDNRGNELKGDLKSIEDQLVSQKLIKPQSKNVVRVGANKTPITKIGEEYFKVSKKDNSLLNQKITNKKFIEEFENAITPKQPTPPKPKAAPKKKTTTKKPPKDELADQLLKEKEETLKAQQTKKKEAPKPKPKKEVQEGTFAALDDKTKQSVRELPFYNEFRDRQDGVVKAKEIADKASQKVKKGLADKEVQSLIDKHEALPIGQAKIADRRTLESKLKEKGLGDTGTVNKLIELNRANKINEIVGKAKPKKVEKPKVEKPKAPAKVGKRGLNIVKVGDKYFQTKKDGTPSKRQIKNQKLIDEFEGKTTTKPKTGEITFTRPNGKQERAIKKDGKWFLPDSGKLLPDGTYEGVFAPKSVVKQIENQLTNQKTKQDAKRSNRKKQRVDAKGKQQAKTPDKTVQQDKGRAKKSPQKNEQVQDAAIERADGVVLTKEIVKEAKASRAKTVKNIRSIVKNCK